MEVYMEFRGKKPFSSFLTYARENGLDITNIQMSKNKYRKESMICVICTVESHEKRTHGEMLDMIGSAEGVDFVEEL